MNRRGRYRLNRDHALTMLCALTDWNDQYVLKAESAQNVPRALFCARQVEDGISAYSAILNRYGWNEHHRSQVKRWRQATSDIRIISARSIEGDGNAATAATEANM